MLPIHSLFKTSSSDKAASPQYIDAEKRNILHVHSRVSQKCKNKRNLVCTPPCYIICNSTLNGPSTSQKWTKNGDLQLTHLLGTLFLLGPLKLEIEKYAFVSGFGREHTDFIVVEKVNF